MRKRDIESAVNSAFSSATASIDPVLDRQLWPDLFENPYTWTQVKNAIKANNALLKMAIIDSLTVLLSD